MSLCIATTSVQGNLPDKLKIISEAGFDTVELHEPDLIGFEGSPRELGAIARDLGLTIAVVQPFEGYEGLDHESRARGLERLKFRLQICKDVGAKALLVATNAAADAKFEMDESVSTFAEAAAFAAEVDLRLALLARPWSTTINNELVAYEIVQKANSENLGIALNSYFSLAGGDRAAKLNTIDVDKVFHVQLSDAPKTKSDISSMKSQFGLLPGQGSLNLESFVRVLARKNYKHSWSLARLGKKNISADAQELVKSGYRALVSLLDDVASTEPNFPTSLPSLPAKADMTGFEFVEFAVQDGERSELTKVLESMCFRKERQHISKSVELWRQGSVNLVLNSEESGHANGVFSQHGPSVCDMGIRVNDAEQTVRRAAALGAEHFSQPLGSGELDIPAVQGVGGNVIHFIDEKSNLHRVWDIEFDRVGENQFVQPAGLRRIDHVAQTMSQQQMNSWLLYYVSTFKTEKSSIVDVADPSGVILSQVVTSPEGEVKLNLNGAADGQTFAGSFLTNRVGPGVQHIAFLTDDIFETSKRLASCDFKRLPVPTNYYSRLKIDYDLSSELVDQMREDSILYERAEDGEYFQIYSMPLFSGFFFEIVQRRNGYSGFGATNASIRLSAQNQLRKSA